MTGPGLSCHHATRGVLNSCLTCYNNGLYFLLDICIQSTPLILLEGDINVIPLSHNSSSLETTCLASPTPQLFQHPNNCKAQRNPHASYRNATGLAVTSSITCGSLIGVQIDVLTDRQTHPTPLHQAFHPPAPHHHLNASSGRATVSRH